MNNKIRVLQVLHGLNRGGIETLLMNLYRNLDKDKIVFDFYIVDKEKCDYEDEIIQLGGKIYRGHSINSFKGLMLYVNEFYKFLKNNNYQIVHCHWNSISAIPLFVAYILNIPIRISHAHIAKWEFNKKYIFKKILRLLLNLFSNVKFACGKDAGVFMYGKKEYQKGHVILLNNAIEAEKFRYNETTRELYRNKLGIESDCFLIGHVGRFSQQKNHKFIIKIFSEFLKLNPKSKLLLIGDGELKDEILILINKYNISNNVTILHNIPDVYNYLQAIDFYIFPSLYEGLSLAIIEAQAAGLQCLASNTIDVNSKVSDNIEFFPLSENANVWAKKIFENINYIRKDNYENICSAGYNSKDAAIWLTKFYTNSLV